MTIPATIKITTIVPVLEGLYDLDWPAETRLGHMTEGEMRKVAAGWCEYPDMSLIKLGSLPDARECWMATFSNQEDAPRDDDGAISEEHEGHLRLYFYHETLHGG